MNLKNFLEWLIRGWLPEEPKMRKNLLKERARLPITIAISAAIIIVSLSVLSIAPTQPTSPPSVPPLSPPEVPTVESNYYPGVSVGDYVTYGNFVCKFDHQGRPGCINNLAFKKMEVIEVSGTKVTFLHTHQYKNGSATPYTGCTETLDVEAAWWSDDTEYCIDYSLIIAANLTEGSCIHLGNCDFPGHTVTRIEERTYLGLSRKVIPLRGPNTTRDDDSTINIRVTENFVYDQESGIKLEHKLITPDGDVIWAMSIIETNIF